MEDDPVNYPDLPARITELGLKLQGRDEAEVVNDVADLLRCVDEFHRRGLTALIEMIQAWRGEIFLESVERHPLAGALLKAYDLPMAT